MRKHPHYDCIVWSVGAATLVSVHAAVDFGRVVKRQCGDALAVVSSSAPLSHSRMRFIGQISTDNGYEELLKEPT